MAQLCQFQDEFRRLDTRVLIVTFGALPAAQAWVKETCAPLPVLLDPDRTAYDAYGLERSLRRARNLRAIWRYTQLLTSGRQWRGIQGDSAQLGGDFAVDGEGIIRLAHRSHDPTDRPAVESTLRHVGELEEREHG